MNPCGTKTLFLDIDGVMNSVGSLFYCGYLQWKAGLSHEDSLEVGANRHFCPIAATALRLILKECPEVRIVISSSWRYSAMDFVERLFLEHGLPWDRVIGRTPKWGKIRGDEIAEWLSSNGPIDDFVIIDDDTDMGDLLPYLVHTDNTCGLTMRQAISIIARFRGVTFETVDKEINPLEW